MSVIYCCREAVLSEGFLGWDLNHSTLEFLLFFKVILDILKPKNSMLKIMGGGLLKPLASVPEKREMQWKDVEGTRGEGKIAGG